MNPQEVVRPASQEPLRPDPARPADAGHGRLPGDGSAEGQQHRRLPAGARAHRPARPQAARRCRPAPRISSASPSTWSRSGRASATCWKCGCCTRSWRSTTRFWNRRVRERTAELRESEARYRSLTELASDWYWEQDENMRVHQGFRPGARDARHPGRPSRRPTTVTGTAGIEAERAACRPESTHASRFLTFVFSRVKADGTPSGVSGQR